MIRSPVGPTVAAVILAGAIGLSAPQEPGPDVRALLAGGLYEQAETAARDRVDNLRDSLGDETLEVAAASDDLMRALVLNGRGTDAQTLALAKRTRRMKEAHLGADHRDLVPTLLNLGEVLAMAAEFEEAVAVTDRAVAMCQKSTAPDSVDLADALDYLGGVLSLARRYPDALSVLERSLRIKEKALDATDVGVAKTLEDIGLVLQRMGAYERAGVTLRRAVAIREAGSTSHPAFVRTLNLIAQQVWFEGDLIESKNASERAVEVAERTLRVDHPLIALSLRYLAATLADLGEMQRSVALRERALAIAERTFGANHQVTAEHLHALAAAALREGAYASARQGFQRALAIFEARYGLRHEYVAAALSRLALVDVSLGDYVNARRELSRAVAIYELMGGPNHPYVANALMELAAVYREQGLPTQALRLLERALAIREKSLGPSHRDVARTLADLASTLAQTGQMARAQAAATRALGIWERLDTPDAPDHATIFALYAELLARRGDDAAARDYYERAMSIRAKVFGTSNPIFADTQAGLALALANLGDHQSALRAAISAESAGRDHLRTMLRSLPERQSLNYAAARPRALDLILSLALLTPEAADSALDGVIRSRALVLDEMATRQSARTSTASSDPLRAAFTSAQQRIANLVVRGPGQLSPAQYTVVLEDARREAEVAEQTLAEKSADYRAERSRAQLGLDDVRASLPPHATLVSFVRYERTLLDRTSPPKASSAATRQPPRTVISYLAFVLRPDQPPTTVPLGSANAIDRLISQWRQDIAVEATSAAVPPDGTVTRSSRDSGAALRKLVWDPLAPHLNGANRIFIVPDGTLSLIPFVALPVGRNSYLLEQAPPIHYVSSERDLALPPTTSSQTTQGLLALGGPAFDSTSGRPAGKGTGSGVAVSKTAASTRAAGAGCESFQAIRFQPLSGTLQEVREVANLWRQGPSSADAAAARVLVGAAASERTFKQEAPGHRVLHLATHGFFLGETCSSVPSGTRAVGGLATSSTRPSATKVENPLLLSGLALAGANRRQRARPDEDDGILTAEEVAALNLTNVEWAVLSACDTGVGQVKAGEGVFGLRRAFQVAGARSVIMSLWSVDDQATRAWMRALYDARFQRGLTTADAVHAASVEVFRDRKAKGRSTNPFFWAAFVAVGDWR